MALLLFKKQFLDAIRRGDKTTTLRRWKSVRVKAGSRANVPGLGWLNILSCDRIKLKDLTEADARSDGFDSLKQLRKTIAQIYPNRANDGRHWFRIVFAPEVDPKAPPVDFRTEIVLRIRAELDNAVRETGSLSRI